MHVFAHAHKQALFEFVQEHPINVSSLGGPAMTKLHMYLSLLNLTKPVYKGFRTLSHKDIQRSQLRYMNRDLSTTGLWQALCSEAMKTRPPTYRHTIDDVYLHLITEFIKENCHGH